MAVDWAATGSMLSGIGTIGGGIALVIAAVLGRKAVEDIRREKLAEREISHAEKALTIAYQLESAISSIRSPVSTGIESQHSREELIEHDWFQALDPAAQDKTIYTNIFYQRIRSYDEDFKEGYSILPTLKAFFGTEAEAALRTILHARHKVRVYADAYQRDRGNDLDHTRKIQSYIWEGALPGEIDPIGADVEKSMTALEDQLIPIIRANAKRITPQPKLKN